MIEGSSEFAAGIARLEIYGMSPVEQLRGASLVIYCDVIEGKGPSRCRREHVDSGFGLRVSRLGVRGG